MALDSKTYSMKFSWLIYCLSDLSHCLLDLLCLQDKLLLNIIIDMLLNSDKSGKFLLYFI